MSRGKAEMVLELIDRASRPARRFMALQQKMEKATRDANGRFVRSSGDAERATDRYTRAVQALSRAQSGLQRGIKRSNDLIRRQAAQLGTAAAMMRGGIMGAGRAALLAGGLYTAYAGSVSLAGASMLGPARQFEKFQTILTTTEGSAEAAQKAMGWVQDFAVSTPYELDQVMASFVQLRAYGLDPTNGLLRTLGDTSAAMGKDVMQAVEAIADAVTGENERLKEFGIKAAKVGKYFEYSYTAKDGSAKVAKALASDRAAIEAALTKIFNERYGGAMELQARTFDGMLSNIMDQWSKFQLMIMGNGVFDWMKSKMKLLLDEIDRLSASGELEAWAKRIADHILTGLNAIWNFGVAAVGFWQRLSPWIERTAEALGGWRNLALALVAIPLRGVIIGTTVSLMQFAGGAALAMKALAGIGFGSAMSGAMRFGQALLALANPINWVRGAFIALRVALLATGIGAAVAGLAMAGVWIYNNWSGLTAFFKGFGEAFMESLGPARPLAERVIGVVRTLWGWIGRLVRPLDASSAQWKEWGRAAGRAVGGVVTWFSGLWGRVSGTLSNGWQAVAAWFSRLWARVRALSASGWDTIKALFLSYTPAGLIYSHWDGIAAWFSGLWSRVSDAFAAGWEAIKAEVSTWPDRMMTLGADIIQGLIDGIRSKFEALAQIVSDVGAKLNPFGDAEVTGSLSGNPALRGELGGGVQARASGGSFRPGWLLTGERGPEIEYRSRGGYIAHNRALRNMAALSGAAARGAALSAGISATAAAPARAGAQYLTARSHSSLSVSAPITLRIEGNVDRGTLPDFKAALADLREQLIDEIEARARAARRREHR